MNRKLRSLLSITFVPLLVLLGLVGWTRHEIVQNERDRALITAIKQNDVPKVIALLDAGANPNIRDLPPDKRSFWQILRDRMKRRELPSSDAPTALLLAEEVCSPQAHVNYVDASPIFVALLNFGANPNSGGQVSTSIKIPVDIIIEGNDTTDTYHATPLSAAISTQKIKTVRLLLQHGADVNARDIEGKTALIESADRNVSTLLRQKVEIFFVYFSDQPSVVCGSTRLIHTCSCSGSTFGVPLENRVGLSA